MTPKSKPPLGVTPRSIWEEQRLCHLKDAMDRYTEAGFPVPAAWKEEFEELAEKVQRYWEEQYARSTPGNPNLHDLPPL